MFNIKQNSKKVLLILFNYCLIYNYCLNHTLPIAIQFTSEEEELNTIEK